MKKMLKRLEMRMYVWIAVAAILTSVWSPARASYFAFLPGHEVQAGLFTPLAGSVAQTRPGGILPIFVHAASATDYLLIPNFGYDALDFGFSGSTVRDVRLGVGPSARLDEPGKALLRGLCPYVLPGWSSVGPNGEQAYAALRGVLAPGKDPNSPTLALGLMPMLDGPSVSQALAEGKAKALTGSLQLSVMLSKTFSLGGS